MSSVWGKDWWKIKKTFVLSQIPSPSKNRYVKVPYLRMLYPELINRDDDDNNTYLLQIKCDIFICKLCETVHGYKKYSLKVCFKGIFRDGHLA